VESIHIKLNISRYQKHSDVKIEGEDNFDDQTQDMDNFVSIQFFSKEEKIKENLNFLTREISISNFVLSHLPIFVYTLIVHIFLFKIIKYKE
jgi:hypothetical protein